MSKNRQMGKEKVREILTRYEEVVRDVSDRIFTSRAIGKVVKKQLLDALIEVESGLEELAYELKEGGPRIIKCKLPSILD